MKKTQIFLALGFILLVGALITTGVYGRDSGRINSENQEDEINTQNGQSASTEDLEDGDDVRGHMDNNDDGESHLDEMEDMLNNLSQGMMQGCELRLRTALAGNAIGGVTPSGNADFRNRSEQNRLKLDVEVEDVNLPAGTTLTVFANNANVGQIVLGASLAEIELELDTQDGQTVPQLSAGQVIRVEGPNGTVLTGTLAVSENDCD